MTSLNLNAKLNSIAGSYGTAGVLTTAASVLVTLAWAQGSSLAVPHLDTVTIKVLSTIGVLVSGMMLIIVMLSDRGTSNLPAGNDNVAQNEGQNLFFESDFRPLVIEPQIVSAIAKNADSGLLPINQWKPNLGVSGRQLIIFDLEFDNLGGSEWPLQSIMSVIGDRLATFCSNTVGLHALHADTLSLAVVSEASLPDFKLVQSIAELLGAPLRMGKAAPTIEVSCRYRALSDSKAVGFNEVQLAIALPGIGTEAARQHENTSDSIIVESVLHERQLVTGQSFDSKLLAKQAANDPVHGPYGPIGIAA